MKVLKLHYIFGNAREWIEISENDMATYMDISYI